MFDIAAQFGSKLTKFLVDMQRFFTQQLLEKFPILGPESSMRPEISLAPQAELFLLTYRLNIPAEDSNCPQEEQVQGVVEDALMEILIKICGAAAATGFKRRNTLGMDDLEAARDGMNTAERKKAERKKNEGRGKKRGGRGGDDESDGPPKREVREISEEEQQFFIAQLLKEMEYRMKALEAMRVMWTDNAGYAPKIWGTDGFAAKENQTDAMGRAVTKKKVGIPGVSDFGVGGAPSNQPGFRRVLRRGQTKAVFQNPDPSGGRQRVELMQKRRQERLIHLAGGGDAGSTMGGSTAGDGGALGGLGTNIGSDGDNMLHPADPLARFTAHEELTPRTKERIDIANPLSFANYQKRVKFLTSANYAEAIADHIHEKFDQGFYSRELQTMYQKVADRHNKKISTQKPKPLDAPKKVRIKEGDDEIEDGASSAASAFDTGGALDKALGAGGNNSGSSAKNSKSEGSGSRTSRSGRTRTNFSSDASTKDEDPLNLGYTHNELAKWRIFDPYALDRLSQKVTTEAKHLDPKWIEKMEKDKSRRLALQRRKRRKLIMDFRRSKSVPGKEGAEKKKDKAEKGEEGSSGLERLKKKRENKRRSKSDRGSDESPEDENKKKEVAVEAHKATNKPSTQLWSEYSRLRGDIYDKFVAYGKKAKPNLKDLFNDQFGTYKRLVEDAQDFPEEMMNDLDAKGSPPPNTVDAKKLDRELTKSLTFEVPP
eukprot:g14691.t1